MTGWWMSALLSPRGRAPLSHWWASRLLFIPFVLPKSVYEDLDVPLGVAVTLSCCALFFVYVVTVIEIKRWHDFGYSGSWILINFIPFGFLVTLFLCGGRQGDAGPNKYGPPAAKNAKPLCRD